MKGTVSAAARIGGIVELAGRFWRSGSETATMCEAGLMEEEAMRIEVKVTAHVKLG